MLVPIRHFDRPVSSPGIIVLADDVDTNLAIATQTGGNLAFVNINTGGN